MAVKGLTLAAAAIAVLILAGCANAPLPPGHWRAATRPCWYDKTKGPGATYQDAEGMYYIGYDYASNSYYKIRGSNMPRNSYIYQPGSEAWSNLYRWNIIKPYVFPKGGKRQ